ncbi:MAG TPA: 3-deoxy-7-phosphoheptulonate synthase [Ktedonobacterales bacterium]|nr:3-deoxy-7-phosphoheptulonate synthase [Ktedonobacterales bacterium]
MIILMKDEPSTETLVHISALLRRAQINEPVRPVQTGMGIACCFGTKHLSADVFSELNALPEVERIFTLPTAYQLASRHFQEEKSIIQVGNAATSQVVEIGSDKPVIMAGPCAVENAQQLRTVAREAAQSGANMLRGGAFKPRSSPYSFQGLGVPGLELLDEARAETGLPVVTEVMEPALVEVVAEHADMLQIGCRNMQNFPLLKAAGRSGKPVLLKRGFSATIEEWLLSAEYILSEGNPNVVLCERGVRSFDPHTRNLLDLSCVPLLGMLTHLPVVVDPSHSTGRRELVVPMAHAAIAAGADGLLVDVHHQPDQAMCDGDQAIMPEELQRLIQGVQSIRASLLRMSEIVA